MGSFFVSFDRKKCSQLHINRGQNADAVVKGSCFVSFNLDYRPGARKQKMWNSYQDYDSHSSGGSFWGTVCCTADGRAPLTFLPDYCPCCFRLGAVDDVQWMLRSQLRSAAASQPRIYTYRNSCLWSRSLLFNAWCHSCPYRRKRTGLLEWI